jgi:hypothetical protein
VTYHDQGTTYDIYRTTVGEQSSRMKAKTTLHILLLDATWIIRTSYDRCRCVYSQSRDVCLRYEYGAAIRERGAVNGTCTGLQMCASLKVTVPLRGGGGRKRKRKSVRGLTSWAVAQPWTVLTWNGTLQYQHVIETIFNSSCHSRWQVFSSLDNVTYCAYHNPLHFRFVAHKNLISVAAVNLE